PAAKYKPVELLNLLYKEMNKIKAYHGIIVRIFDEPLKKALKTLVKYIYAKKFIKKVKIPLFDGIEPVLARDAKLIYWFKQKEKKGMVIEVEADEVLVEYKKPVFAKNGFNAYGKYIHNDTAKTINDLKAKVDSKTIYIEEDEFSKKYIAKQKGYVYYDGSILAIDNTLRLNEISRNKNILDSDEEKNNIELLIKQHDITKDSIGEGVELSSEHIHVDGFVGAKSKLEAKHLEIDGATHQDSKQFAKYAKINRHKGTLHCYEANIKLLEGGIVHATKVTIENSLNGFVYAQDVTIKQVRSNLKVYATNSITIDLVSGEDNLFEINYEQVPVVLSKIEHIQEEIEELRYKKKQAKRFHPDEVETLKQKIQEAKEQIQKIKESYKYASIEVKHPFKGLNTIVFSIDKEHRLVYKTQNKHYEAFHIEIKDDLVILQPPAISLSLSDQNNQ
ncbi:MAG: flagellar assembly protein A, partial [Sulfurimonas sp.]